MPSSGVKTSALDRKSTRLNSSHGSISYAVFCLKKNIIMHRRIKNVLTLKQLTLLRNARSTIRTESITRFIFIPAFRAVFFFNDTATTEIYTLSLHDALPI